jgi:hypothetical protein
MMSDKEFEEDYKKWNFAQKIFGKYYLGIPLIIFIIWLTYEI